MSIFISNSYVVDSYDETLEEIENFNIKQNLTLLTNDSIVKIIREKSNRIFNDIEKIGNGGVSRFETHNGLKGYFYRIK